MSRGCQHVRSHCVCVTAGQGEEARISFLAVTANKCDFLTALELSSVIKKERRDVNVAAQSLSQKSASSLRSAAGFNVIFSTSSEIKGDINVNILARKCMSHLLTLLRV